MLKISLAVPLSVVTIFKLSPGQDAFHCYHHITDSLTSLHDGSPISDEEIETGRGQMASPGVLAAGHCFYYDPVLLSDTVLPGIRYWLSGSWHFSGKTPFWSTGCGLVTLLERILLGILTRCLGCTSGVQLLDLGQGLTASQEY